VFTQVAVFDVFLGGIAELAVVNVNEVVVELVTLLAFPVGWLVFKSHGCHPKLIELMMDHVLHLVLCFLVSLLARSAFDVWELVDAGTVFQGTKPAAFSWCRLGPLVEWVIFQAAQALQVVDRNADLFAVGALMQIRDWLFHKELFPLLHNIILIGLLFLKETVPPGRA
jgi:hypothetical protein